MTCSVRWGYENTILLSDDGRMLQDICPYCGKPIGESPYLTEWEAKYHPFCWDVLFYCYNRPFEATHTTTWRR